MAQPIVPDPSQVVEPETKEVEEVETKPTVNDELELTSNRKETQSGLQELPDHQGFSEEACHEPSTSPAPLHCLRGEVSSCPETEAGDTL